MRNWIQIFITCTSPIMHLICPPPPPPPKFCITFVFQLSWVLQLSQEKLKTMLMQNFGGQIRGIMGDVQVVNESLKSKFSFIHFVYNLMIALSGKNIIWLSGKCFRTKEKETRVKFNPRFVHWALGTTAVPGETFNNSYAVSHNCNYWWCSFELQHAH